MTSFDKGVRLTIVTLARWGFAAGVLFGASPVAAVDAAELDAFVRSVMASTRIPGVAVAVVESGRVAFAGGWGEDGRGNAVTADTPFWIGSNTKSFTALAVMQLAEQRRVALDAPVQRYLPAFELARPGAAQAITVRHLLEQTSGLPRSAGLRPVLERTRAEGEQLLTRLARVEPIHEAGAAFEYCNWNYVLLGQVIEALTGQRWQSYVQEAIFEPLAMEQSFTGFEAARAAGMTRNHRYLFGFPIPVDDDYLPGFAATGYLVASARDMGRYLAMLQSGGRAADGTPVLSADGVDSLLRPASPPAASTLLGQRFRFRYGKGWFVGAFGGVEAARWHLGQLDSFHAWMALDRRRDRAIVVLANANSFLPVASSDLGRLGPGVMHILLGEKPPAAPSLRWVYGLMSFGSLLIVASLSWLAYRTCRRGAGFVTGAAALTGAAVVAAGWPALTGLSWPSALRTMPDVSAVVLTVALLLMVMALGPLQPWASRQGR